MMDCVFRVCSLLSGLLKSESYWEILRKENFEKRYTVVFTVSRSQTFSVAGKMLASAVGIGMYITIVNIQFTSI